MVADLVVFDLDDTLYPEVEYVESGFNAVGLHVRQRFGAAEFKTVAKRLFDEGVRNRVFNLALAEIGIEPAPRLISELVDVYRSHPPELILSIEVAQVLGDLGRSRQLALLTDGFATSQRLKISSLRLEPYFGAIVVTGEHPVSWRKPGISGFQHLQSFFGVPPSRAIYVGDNPAKDFEGPQSLGWNVARIRLSQGIYNSLPTPRGVTEFASLTSFTACYQESTGIASFE